MADFARLQARKGALTLQNTDSTVNPPIRKASTDSQTVQIPVFAHDFSRVKVHSSAPRDATFVAVNTTEDLEKLLAIANQRADKEFLASSLRSLGTVSNADESSVKAKELDSAKAVLQNQFGKGWGLFFFWTRGGGKAGDGSPIWDILGAARHLNTRMGTEYPPSRYPNAPRISPIKLPAIPLTERDR